jgi:hypothetical protein
LCPVILVTLTAYHTPKFYLISTVCQQILFFSKNGISNFIKISSGFFSVVSFLLANSPASEFYMPMFRYTLFHLHRQVDTECYETLAYKIRTVGNYAEESIQHSEHDESLKSILFSCFKCRLLKMTTLRGDPQKCKAFRHMAAH